jgi:hypothetical protein
VDVMSEEKIKAENLHGLDLNDRELIFSSLLPEEKFVDRRINMITEIPPESESDPETIDLVTGNKIEHGSTLGSQKRTGVGRASGGSIGSRKSSVRDMQGNGGRFSPKSS